MNSPNTWNLLSICEAIWLTLFLVNRCHPNSLLKNEVNTYNLKLCPTYQDKVKQVFWFYALRNYFTMKEKPVKKINLLIFCHLKTCQWSKNYLQVFSYSFEKFEFCFKIVNIQKFEQAFPFITAIFENLKKNNKQLFSS